MTDDREPVFGLRLPADLRTKLQKAADDNHRSLTAETLLRLQQSFAGDVRKASDTHVEDVVNRLTSIEAVLKEAGLLYQVPRRKGKKR